VTTKYLKINAEGNMTGKNLSTSISKEAFSPPPPPSSWLIFAYSSSFSFFFILGALS
jgi:hypothetical protein